MYLDEKTLKLLDNSEIIEFMASQILIRHGRKEFSFDQDRSGAYNWLKYSFEDLPHKKIHISASFDLNGSENLKQFFNEVKTIKEPIYKFDSYLKKIEEGELNFTLFYINFNNSPLVSTLDNFKKLNHKQLYNLREQNLKTVYLKNSSTPETVIKIDKDVKWKEYLIKIFFSILEPSDYFAKSKSNEGIIKKIDQFYNSLDR